MRVIIPSNDEERVGEIAEQVASTIYPDTIYICNDRHRQGKGWAIKQALGGGETIIIDGDGDINPKEILKLMPYVNKYDAIIGTKQITKLPFRRKIVSLLSRLFIKLLFNLPVSDTQTGLKIFKKLPDFKIDGFACDVDMLRRCKKIKQVPIDVKIDRQVRAKSIWNTIKELLILKCR